MTPGAIKNGPTRSTRRSHARAARAARKIDHRRHAAGFACRQPHHTQFETGTGRFGMALWHMEKSHFRGDEARGHKAKELNQPMGKSHDVLQQWSKAALSCGPGPRPRKAPARTAATGCQTSPTQCVKISWNGDTVRQSLRFRPGTNAFHLRSQIAMALVRAVAERVADPFRWYRLAPRALANHRFARALAAAVGTVVLHCRPGRQHLYSFVGAPRRAVTHQLRHLLACIARCPNDLPIEAVQRGCMTFKGRGRSAGPESGWNSLVLTPACAVLCN